MSWNTEPHVADQYTLRDGAPYLASEQRLERYFRGADFAGRFQFVPVIAYIGETRPMDAGTANQVVFALWWPSRECRIYVTDSRRWPKHPSRPWLRAVWYYFDPNGRLWEYDGPHKRRELTETELF